MEVQLQSLEVQKQRMALKRRQTVSYPVIPKIERMYLRGDCGCREPKQLYYDIYVDETQISLYTRRQGAGIMQQP